MGIFCTDEGTYFTTKDRKLKPLFAKKSSMSIQGRELYTYDRNTGILKVSINKDGLEILAHQFGEIPKEGKDILFPTPFESVYLEKVKKIERIPDLNGNGYLMQFEVIQCPTFFGLKKESFLDKLKKYLSL